MEYLYEVEYVDSDFFDARSSVRDLEGLVTSRETRRVELESTVAKLEAEKFICDYLVQLGRTLIERENLGGSHAESDLNRLEYGYTTSNLLDARNELERVRRDIPGYQQRLAVAKETLSKYPEDYNGSLKLNKDDVQRAFQHVSGIRPGSIALYKENALTYLRWVFTDIWATSAERDTYKWINYGKPFEIAIPDTEVSICLPARTCYMRFAGKPVSTGFRFGGHDKPHPHIMSGDGPCLGDFGGPYTEALHEQDFETVATILRMFLETFDIDDSAGKHAVCGVKLVHTDKPLHIGQNYEPNIQDLPLKFRDDYNNVMLVPTDERGVYEFILPEMELGPVT